MRKINVGPLDTVVPAVIEKLRDDSLFRFGGILSAARKRPDRGID
jgi:hypothetical protein